MQAKLLWSASCYNIGLEAGNWEQSTRTSPLMNVMWPESDKDKKQIEKYQRNGSENGARSSTKKQSCDGFNNESTNTRMYVSGKEQTAIWVR